METAANPRPDSSFDPMVALEERFLPVLIDVVQVFRRAAFAGDSATIIRTVEEGIIALDAVMTQWDPLFQTLPELRSSLLFCREEVRKLLGMSGSFDELRRSAWSRFYLLEAVPSQISAAIEQGQIDRKEAPSRFQLINEIIALRGARSYLEIGCCKDDCFNEVRCAQRVGVDPGSGGTLRMTSDEFFKVNVQRFDVIFIDGLHEAWQVDRDIVNALRWLNPNGVIVMHDCNPLFDIRTLVPRMSDTWNGDTWKSLVRARSRGDIDCATGRFDHGCGVILPRPNSAPLERVAEERLTWDELSANRASWLRPMEFGELMAWIRG